MKLSNILNVVLKLMKSWGDKLKAARLAWDPDLGPAQPDPGLEDFLQKWFLYADPQQQPTLRLPESSWRGFLFQSTAPLSSEPGFKHEDSHAPQLNQLSGWPLSSD